MNDKQPEALRLADILEHKIPSIECLKQAAAELRRLDGDNRALEERNAHWVQAQIRTEKERKRLADENESLKASLYGKYELEKMNAELVEALEEVPYMSNKDDYARLAKLIARAKRQQ